MAEAQSDSLNVAEVQTELLADIVSACATEGVVPILSDPVLSVRPSFWICATPQQKQRIVDRLTEGCVRIYELGGRKRVPLDGIDDQARLLIAYKRYVADGVVIHGAASGIQLMFCAFQPDTGVWKAPRAGLESHATQAHLDSLDRIAVLGQHLPTFRNVIEVMKQHPASTPVDIVYTWVNGNDPDWAARRAAAARKDGLTRDADASSRYDPGQDLLFSLRSVLRYFKNHGRIFVVTDGQTPDMLGDLQQAVTLVDHREIFEDPAHLPTFNSHAIEANLHRIPGLSRRYIYLNDDVFFGAAVSAAHFFDDLGRSFYFPSGFAVTPSAPLSDPDSAADAAARNNQRAIQARFGTFPYLKFKHAPIALDRQVMEEMERDLPQVWAQTLPNRFRSDQDHSISGHLYFHYAACLGRAVRGEIRYTYFGTAKSGFAARLATLEKEDWARPETFCINDTSASQAVDDNKALAHAVLQRIFPGTGMVLDRQMPNRGPAPAPDTADRKRFAALRRRLGFLK